MVEKAAALSLMDEDESEAEAQRCGSGFQLHMS